MLIISGVSDVFIKSGVACQYVCYLRVVCVLRVVWPVSMRVN